jgi:hypothetical protein
MLYRIREQKIEEAKNFITNPLVLSYRISDSGKFMSKMQVYMKFITDEFDNRDLKLITRKFEGDRLLLICKRFPNYKSWKLEQEDMHDELNEDKDKRQRKCNLKTEIDGRIVYVVDLFNYHKAKINDYPEKIKLGMKVYDSSTTKDQRVTLTLEK